MLQRIAEASYTDRNYVLGESHVTTTIDGQTFVLLDLIDINHRIIHHIVRILK